MSEPVPVQSAPQQWEYRTETFSARDDTASQTKAEATKGTRLANHLGIEGWRLIGPPSVSGNTVYFWFERPVTEEQA